MHRVYGWSINSIWSEFWLFVASDRPEAVAIFKYPHTETHFQKENINITSNYARNERYFRPNFRFSTNPPFWKISRPSFSRFWNFHFGTQTPKRNVTCHIQINWSYAYQNTSWLNGLERLPREHKDPRSSPRWTIKTIFFKNLLSYRMRNSPTLTTLLRRVGEFNTSLIASLKLPKKSIITRSRQEKAEQKNPSWILNSALFRAE